jgi:hypothetical protein
MTLEQKLGEALRPVDPGPDFTAAVLARVQRAQDQGHRRRSRWQVPVALAASLLVAFAGLALLQQQRDREAALQARQQLLLALSITSEQLNHVQQKLSAKNEENGT